MIADDIKDLRGGTWKFFLNSESELLVRGRSIFRVATADFS